MPNLFEQGEAMLSKHLEASGSVHIVYRRGEEACELSATLGQTAFEIHTEFGVESLVTRDYLVERTNLVLSSGQVVPQRGDRIWQLIDGATIVHEVMTPGDMKEYEPARETRWRIHTKLVEQL